MAKGCGPMCAKGLLFGFNFLFWLSGLALVAVGILAFVDKGFQDLEVFLPSELRVVKMVAAILIGMGIFILIIGFCGCCGAIRESKCLLGLYIFLLVVVMAGEIAIGVYVVLKKGTIERNFTKEALKMLNYYPVSNESSRENEAFKLSVDEFQSRAHCCGINNKTDWMETDWYKKAKGVPKSIGVPKSCCSDYTSEKFKYEDCKGKAFENGCKEKTLMIVKDNLPIIIGVGFGVAFLEILGLLLSVCLCRAIGREDASNNYY